jgi:hypothetical protein
MTVIKTAIDEQKAFGAVIIPPKQTEYLNCLTDNNGLILPATQKRIISDTNDIFPGWIDQNFKNWNADDPGQPQPEIVVDVWEQKKDGKFIPIFNSLGQPADQLLTHEQIIVFCQRYPNWLHPEGFATFFLFKSDKIKSDNEIDKFFVASANRAYRALLKAGVYRFGRLDCWDAERRSRFVVPRLAVTQ